MIGNPQGLPDSKKCLDSYKKENFKLLKTKKMPDFMIHLVAYEK